MINVAYNEQFKYQAASSCIEYYRNCCSMNIPSLFSNEISMYHLRGLLLRTIKIARKSRGAHRK